MLPGETDHAPPERVVHMLGNSRVMELDQVLDPAQKFKGWMWECLEPSASPIAEDRGDQFEEGLVPLGNACCYAYLDEGENKVGQKAYFRKQWTPIGQSGQSSGQSERKLARQARCLVRQIPE